MCAGKAIRISSLSRAPLFGDDDAMVVVVSRA